MLQARIINRREEAEGIVSLQLESAGAAPLPPFEAGAHVDVHVAPGLVRPYSLCNDPRERGRYQLGVLREPASRGGSSGIHAGFDVGRTVTLGAPRNNFRLNEEARHSVLCAGGIGITPLMAMAWRLHALGASFELHYCSRTLARTAFRRLLRDAPFARQVHLHLDDGAAVQRFDAATVLAGPAAGRHLYACGPAGFMAHVTGEATRLGWAGGQVHVEHFSAQVDSAGAAFSVHAARSGVTVDVPPGRSMAQCLLAQGVVLPLSCEQGVCGTCITGVLEGQPDHRDECLTPEERASNRLVTPCCSRALSPRLVLDV